MQKIVAYTGTHGTGKTTKVYQAAACLCKEHPQKRIGVLCETAGQCPYPVNMESTPVAQSWIFHNHIARELDMMRHYDILASDRTCMDAVAYTRVLGFFPLAAAMEQIAHMHLHHYKRIYFKRMAHNPYWCENGLRETTSADFRERVEIELIRLYQNAGVMDWITYV